MSFCPLSPLSALLTQSDWYLKDCVESQGWVVGIASHWSVIQPRDLLVTVEAPGYPKNPSPIEHDPVVKDITAIKIYVQINEITFDFGKKDIQLYL